MPIQIYLNTIYPIISQIADAQEAGESHYTISVPRWGEDFMIAFLCNLSLRIQILSRSKYETTMDVLF